MKDPKARKGRRAVTGFRSKTYKKANNGLVNKSEKTSRSRVQSLFDASCRLSVGCALCGQWYKTFIDFR